jgi:adenylate kinase
VCCSTTALTPPSPPPPPLQIQENVQCEIMMVVLEEAADSYKDEVIKALPSNNVEEMEANVAAVVEWMRQHQSR